MLLTIDAGLAARGTETDVEVMAGTPLAAVLDTVGARGADVWCGPHQLMPEHPAGTYPLMHGARLAAHPAEASAAPVGPFVAAVAGPDAGVLVSLEALVEWGRDAVISVDDPALSRQHLSTEACDGRVVFKDLGSTNGMRGWNVERRRGQLRGSGGALVRAGTTYLQVRNMASDTAKAASPKEGRSRLATMAGMAVSAIVLAAVTGRWYLALAGAIMPLIVLAPTLKTKFQSPAPQLDCLPDPHHHFEPALEASLAEPPAANTSSVPDWNQAVAIIGQSPWTQGVARAVALNRGRAVPPSAENWSEPWMDWLPPAAAHDGPILVGDTAPSWCAVVVEADASGTVIRRTGHPPVTTLPLHISAQRADFAARRIAGLNQSAALPHTVRWADLVGQPEKHAGVAKGTGTGFRAAIGSRRPAVAQAGPAQPWWIDLDEHGPHFLVAGTTGSGKSVFLETLILSLCHQYGPHQLELALLDFKGGAGMRECMGLPHVVGIVTDLDGRQARRALSALAAEVVERKERLADAGFASFTQWEAAGGAPARLLIVADEFQEIGAHHREFIPDLTRIAAQGRSLGMHVVLATQRPAGAVTPEIRANTATTIAFRVASDAESRDVIGTPEAATISPAVPGRAVVAHSTDRYEVQVALPVATPTAPVRVVGDAQPRELTSLTEVVMAKWGGAGPPRSLWQPPLPAVVTHGVLAGLAQPASADGARLIPLGIDDLPQTRQRLQLAWDTDTGPVLVVGMPGSERSLVLNTIAAGAGAVGLKPVWLPPDPREAARTIWLTRERADVLLLVEDAASAMNMLAEVDRGTPADALLARGSLGLPLALAVGYHQQLRLATTATLRVFLAGAQATEVAMWSIPRALADIDPTPGSATVCSGSLWRESRLLLTETRSSESVVSPLPTGAQLAAAAPVSDNFVGVGGDEAQLLTWPSGQRVTVVGGPSRSRDEFTSRLEANGSTVVCVDNPLLLPPAARDGVLVAMEPHPRLSDDWCKGSGFGLVDPSPPRGRVLWVAEGSGQAVQLFPEYAISEAPSPAVGN